jgi:hypothetical protein
MPLRITPTKAAFPRSGGQPSFRVETDGDLYFAVQLATTAILLNGANANRRAPDNWFDSWAGDAAFRGTKVPLGKPIVGEHLEAATGKVTYTVPAPAWERLKHSDQLFYRLVVAADERRRDQRVSVADLDWARAPALSIGSVPAQRRSAASAFPGSGGLDRTDFLAEARRQLDAAGSVGLVGGRDGDYRYVVLDARLFDMTAIECHEYGLTDTVEKMPRKPDAIVNAQFISGLVGVGTEGQVVREGLLINSDSRTDRDYIVQRWNATSVSGIRIAKGDPGTAEPSARVGFGGLGPLLHGGGPVSPLSAWAQSVYGRAAETGRGVIGVDRARELVVLIVQENGAAGAKTVPLKELRDRLRAMGLTDAVFNDGSDSEALFVGGSWLLKPAYAKVEVMDFAMGFVRRTDHRRIRSLVIDGTKTKDGETFAAGITRPLLTQYRPQNLADELRTLPAMAPLASTFHSSIIEAWRTTSDPQRQQIVHLVEQAGTSGQTATVLYLACHAWRHGQLWYHLGDVDPGGAIQMVGNLWSPSAFHPSWITTPSWLIVAGCAVLGLHYSRFVQLTAIERGHLVGWHRDIYGPSATVPSLTPAGKTLFAVYHPGWAWHERIFSKAKSLRGVLGFWHRSPGAEVGDVDLVTEFSKRLCQGETFVGAWEATNKRAFYQAEAPWAAMIRKGCEDDSLATLERPALGATGEFLYYDRYQRAAPIATAYVTANTPDDAVTIGGARVHHNTNYDHIAIDEGKKLSPAPTTTDLVIYSDGLGPPPLKAKR